MRILSRFLFLFTFMVSVAHAYTADEINLLTGLLVKTKATYTHVDFENSRKIYAPKMTGSAAMLLFKSFKPTSGKVPLAKIEAAVGAPLPTPTPAPTPVPTPSPSPTPPPVTSLPTLPSTVYKSDQIAPIRIDGLQFSVQSAERPYSFATDGNSMRFEAHQGDRRQKPSEIDRPIKRCEISFSPEPYEFGSTYEITYGFYIEPGVPLTAANFKFDQVHGSPDSADYGSLGPVLALQLQGERFRVVGRWDANATTPARTKDNWLYEGTGNLLRGVRHDVRKVIRFDPMGNGKAEVWLDGIEIVNYQGPLGYNDAQPPYQKFGIYSEDSPEPVAIWFLDLKIRKLN